MRNDTILYILIRIDKGFELFCDLCLADCLATGGTASRVVIQLKGHPTFVSDAMAKDMLAMIDLLADLDASEYPRYARGIASIYQFRGCRMEYSGMDVGERESRRVVV